MKRTLLVAAIAAATATAAPAQDFYMGQIIGLGGNYCPIGTMAADGRLLPIAEHSALFSLFGNTYGGDARTNFALPDLRAKDANGQPIAWGQPGAALTQCVIERGYYPPRN